MNPFTDKSLQDLIDMAPSLSDPELNALCAKYCEGYIQSWDNNRPSWLPPGKSGRGGACPKYTTDPREAMRLLVKYRLNVQWGQDTRDPSDKTLCVLKSINPGPIDLISLIPDMDLLGVICRAITLAAVTLVLAQMMKGDG